MRKFTGGVYLLLIAALVLMAAPLFANNTNHRSRLPQRTVRASGYNIAKEVTLDGTVQSVDRKANSRMMLGARLTVATAQGTVEADIGRFLLRGPHAVSFSAGQQVRLVGMMTTINRGNVLLTRVIETRGQTITVRNEQGFLVSPAAKMFLTRISAAGGAR
jgi:hypothetical protein